MKICTNCKANKELSEFRKRSKNKDLLQSWCKTCESKAVKIWQKEHIESVNSSKRKWAERNKENSRCWAKNNPRKVLAKNARRRANKTSQTPAWANLDLISKIYINCPKGKVVDHIIPLQGKLVSGFHVEYNLQYLTRSENCKKGNKLLTPLDAAKSYMGANDIMPFLVRNPLSHTARYG